MRIACISDMHSNFKFKVQPCDLLLIAGDICPAYHDKLLSISLQYDFLKNKFYKWLSKQPVKECVFVFGNHDWIGDFKPLDIPKLPDNCHYLEDSSIEIMGMKIYGTPVQLPFNDWAFNRREQVIKMHWDQIPIGLDILLLHSPPYGILDETNHPNHKTVHIGSLSLKEKIEEVRPQIVVFGHNHGEHGIKEIDGITYINASLIDENYDMVKEPIYLEI